MSDQKSREQRSKRLHDEETKVLKRSKTLKELHVYFPKHPVTEQPHRLHKNTGMNCGNPNCIMCSNPRKIFHERTLQEQSFRQDKLWSEE